MIVINLFAGPGCGKTTVAAEVFAEMKKARINCEYVPEKAKELTWADRHDDLACQPAVFGSQLNRLWRLRNKVDIVVTDSPILLSMVYAEGWPASFHQSIVDIHNTTPWENWNYLLLRDRSGYQTEGRTQTIDESISIDGKLSSLLTGHNIDFKHLRHNSIHGTATEIIMRDVQAFLTDLEKV